MTLTQLKYVITIADTGSMNEAAKLLFISQPSLSLALKELENEIGTELFKRSNRGVVLTPEGQEFLGYARQVTEQYKLELSAEQKAHTEAKLLETTAFVSLEVTYSVDPAILGGLVIRIGDRVVDSSIKTRLGEIRRDLMKLQLA